MCRFVFALGVLAVGFCLTVSARAGNIETPDYPLNAVEKLYADLAKLPAAERHKKILDGAAKEEKLESIHTMGGALARGYAKLFQTAYPSVKNVETFVGTQQAVERLVAEERVGRHLTDVLGGDLTELSESLEKGYLARYPTPANERILPQYKTFQDPHNRWLVFMWSEQGISYNSKLVKAEDAPKDWFDLCDPKHKGQVSFEPTRTRFYVFLYNMLGEERMVEWMKCMGKNEPILMRGQTARMELMLAGDHAIQGTNFFYHASQLLDQKGPARVPFRPVYSAPLAANGSGCIINRNTPHPYGAALNCDWRMDKEPQQYITDNYRGAVTMPHKFIPADVQLVSTGPMPIDLVDKLNAYWAEHVAKKR